jgi:hypothetical protein
MEFAMFSPAALSSRRINRPRTRSSNSPSSGQPEILGKVLLLKLLTNILLAAYKTDELKTDRWPVFNLGDGKTFTAVLDDVFTGHSNE